MESGIKVGEAPTQDKEGTGLYPDIPALRLHFAMPSLHLILTFFSLSAVLLATISLATTSN
jgi:hypothetical protein